MRRRMGMGNGAAVAMTPSHGGGVGEVDSADPAEALVPLVAAPVPAAAVPAVGVPAMSADELNRPHGRRRPGRGQRAPDNARFGAIGEQRPSERETAKP